MDMDEKELVQHVGTNLRNAWIKFENSGLSSSEAAILELKAAEIRYGEMIAELKKRNFTMKEVKKYTRLQILVQKTNVKTFFKEIKKLELVKTFILKIK
jgi:hypothetical protein